MTKQPARNSYNLHVCLNIGDYHRLQRLANEAGMRVSALLRHYISIGLRAETYEPLAPVPHRGRPRGARNRRTQ